MKVNSINTQAHPSFGMAKLTQKGRKMAQTHIGDKFKTFAKQTPYTKRNVLKKMLTEGQEWPAISDFFKYGCTCFEDKNAQFIKKQILPITGRRTISRLLKEDSAQAAKSLGTNVSNTEALPLSNGGKLFVEALLDVFDTNIGNTKVPKKNGLKFLDLIKQYITPEQHISRAAILSDKMYSIK